MTPRPSHLRRCIRERRTLFAFKSNVPHPLVIELLAGRGVRGLWLDMEHFATSVETMAALVQTCRGFDTDAIVRVGNHGFGDAGRMLDAGADAIMYPRATAAAEVAELVRWCRFPPRGHRGLDHGTPFAGYSGLTTEQIVARERETTLVVQIETPEALADVDAIAAVPGVDLLFLGPGDLAFAHDVTGDAARDLVAAASERVARTAAKHGLAWGMPAGSLDHARQLAARGAALVPVGSDTSLLAGEVQRAMTSLESE